MSPATSVSQVPGSAGQTGPLGASGSFGTTGVAGGSVVASASGHSASTGSGGIGAAAGIRATAGVSVAGAVATAGTTAVAGTSAGGSGNNAAGGTTPVTMRPPMPSEGCGKTGTPPTGDMMIDVNGTMREYIVGLPSNYDPNKPYRLIFEWHGLGGTAMQIAQSFGSFGWYGLQSLSMNTAIFIAGQGLPTGMATGQGGAGSGMDTSYGWPNTGDRDIEFVRKLLDFANTNYCIDKNRIFSVGMSYGGIMSDTIGCELGDVFRAIAPMSGSGPYAGFGSKPCVGEVAVWMSHGDMDTTVPTAQGEMSRDHWAMANHCSMNTVMVDPSPCVAYQGCDADYPVTWCLFSGGHTIPPFAAMGIWNFLAQF